MSTPLSANPALIRVRPSRWLLFINLVMHGCVITALWMTAIPLWSRLVIIVLIIIHGIYQFYRWRSVGICQLIHQSEQWYLQKSESTAERWQIVSCYYWSRWLVIIKVAQVNAGGAKTRIIYWPIVFDSCEALAFQRLRVICRFLV